MAKLEFNSTTELMDFVRDFKGLLDTPAKAHPGPAPRLPARTNFPPSTADFDSDDMEEDYRDEEDFDDDAPPRPDGGIDISHAEFRYEPQAKRPYIVQDERYREGALISFVIYGTFCSVNFDPGDRAEDSAYTPFPVNLLDRTKTRSAADKLYRKAYLYARRQDECCVVAICQGGKLLLPCYTFYNPHRPREADYLACVFNARPCTTSYRNIYSTLDAQVGNLQEYTDVSFCRGAEIDWMKVFREVIDQARELNPDFDPYQNRDHYLK